jgi:hypothetical protein
MSAYKDGGDRAMMVKSVYTGRSAVVQSLRTKPVAMNRMTAFLAATLIAAAPFSAASAQDGPQRGDRDRDRRPPREQQVERPRMTQSEAQQIAESRARGARYVGFVSFDGARYTYRFDDGRGRVFDVIVDARR